MLKIRYKSLALKMQDLSPESWYEFAFKTF